jgi:hypothetical protein
MSQEETERLKRLMDSALLEIANPPKNGPTEVGVYNFFNDVLQHKCGIQKVPFNFRAAMEYWWDLARLGVIALPGDSFGNFASGAGDLRSYKVIVTERGQKLLERGEHSPHDPTRYIDAVRKRVASPDETALGYLNEAVGAWRADLCRASAVMLGCACERLILQLGEAIAKSNVPTWPAKIQKKLSSASSHVSQLFDEILKCLTDLHGQGKLPKDIGDALDRKLSAIFDHARILRNTSGHPTGDEVSAEDAEAGLLLFPGFYSLIDGLCRHLTSIP